MNAPYANISTVAERWLYVSAARHVRYSPAKVDLLTALKAMLAAAGAGHLLAAGTLVGSQHLLAHALRWGMRAASSAQPEPMEMRIAEDLTSRVTDKDLLHTCGFVGGKWLQASDRSTYQVRNLAGVGLHMRATVSYACESHCGVLCTGAEPSNRQAVGHHAKDES